MDFSIRSTKLVASKQNRNRKFNRTAPSMKNFFRIMLMIKRVVT